MKALLLAALAAVLCVERAHTLVCFSCSDASSNWGCLKPVTCGENENYCVTTYVGVGLGGKSGQSISKGCSPICPSAGINVGIAAASVYCCDSFLCNISGSSSVKASYTVLALGILASAVVVSQTLCSSSIRDLGGWAQPPFCQAFRWSCLRGDAWHQRAPTRGWPRHGECMTPRETHSWPLLPFSGKQMTCAVCFSLVPPERLGTLLQKIQMFCTARGPLILSSGF
uniref:UPAR/Ly6 domain-containing protein n=1 Tax=Cairina moschata TaxID=8855 RepID=A0A8C3GGR4_CAIMO